MYEQFEIYFKLGCSFLGGFLGWFLGGFDGLIKVLVVFAVIDYITGVMSASATKTVSSKAGFKGIFKKIIMFLIVGIANILDVEVLKDGSLLRSAIIFFYLANEGISILENAAVLDLPIPEQLKGTLINLKEKKED